MKRRTGALVLAIGILLSLTGCGDREETAEEADPVEIREPEIQEPAGRNPLTGEEMDPEDVNHRPIAVMFNNLKAAQPQLGVSQADIIYEIPAEGGITRMLGVYQSLEGVGNLGSIRSTRTYYLEAALGHDALLVHAGGSPEAYRKIPRWGVDQMDGVRGGSDAKIFWRDADRKRTAGYEHSLLTSGEKILEYLETGRYRTEHEAGYQYPQTFAEDGTPSGGTPATAFKLYYTHYKTGVFQYDAGTRTYQISQYGAPYTDGNTGEQIGVTNVLLLETRIRQIPEDTAGRLSVQMSGSGNGTYFCGGQSIPIQWSKADRNSPFLYWLTDGTPLTLGRGTSYVCILDPNTSRVEVTA